MTHKQKFIAALKREKITGRVPTFELTYFLTMEKLGIVHPTQMNFYQWMQMSAHEQELHRRQIAFCFTETARVYDHSAIFVHPNPGDFENTVRLLETIRETTGDEYYLCMHGDPTFAIPEGTDMEDFAERLYFDGQGVLDEQRRIMDKMLEFAQKLKQRDGGKLLDGFTLCSDYCFNVNPFYSPELFAKLIAPVLREVIKGYHDLGYYVIKHTDGNIMPIVDQIIDCQPDGLHSLDPQAGVDLKYMKQHYNDKVCLIGNVNCGLLQTGTEEEVYSDVRRCLRDGMPGYGFIFSTSNCVYTGLPLERYELMMKIWREEGVYKQ